MDLADDFIIQGGIFLNTKKDARNFERKMPWYIWFSILAFAILWANTKKQAILYDKTGRLHMRALGQLFKWFFIMVSPVVLLGVVLGVLLSSADPFIREMSLFAPLILLYVLGIFSTYKHAQWRKKNILHLEKTPDESN
jgi:uncharacterized membrane protein YbjE (DUF340 family)